MTVVTISSRHDAVLQSVFRPVSVEEDSAAAPNVVHAMAAAMADSMRDTYAMMARKTALFQGIEAEEVARLFARGSTREYGEGGIIFEKGQPGAEMFVILCGEVQIQDDDREIAVLSPGAMFGEMALMSEALRSAAAKALSPVSLLVLKLDDIKNGLSQDVSTQLLINIIVTLSERLRLANGPE